VLCIKSIGDESESMNAIGEADFNKNSLVKYGLSMYIATKLFPFSFSQISWCS